MTDALMTIIRDFTREAGVRNLRARNWARAARKVVTRKLLKAPMSINRTLITQEARQRIVR